MHVLEELKMHNIIAYVGSLTSSDTKNDISRFALNPQTGALGLIDAQSSGDDNPTWLAIDPSNRYLYAANSVTGDTTPHPDGSISAFAINGKNGQLAHLNNVNSHGSNPAHCSIHPSGKWLLVANYGAAGNHSASVIAINDDGSLGALVDQVHIPVGPPELGAQIAVDAPTGSYAISGHDAPHAHQFQCDGAGKFAFLTDLGTDRTLIYAFDADTGKLKQTEQNHVCETSGAGPRHFVFHPNGRYFYLINEEASTVSFLTYESDTGALTPRQTLPTLPLAYSGTSFTSEIIMSPDGRFLYGLNRLHDSIAIFKIHENGELELIGEEWTRGSYPRHAAISPTGEFLYVCNERSDNITIFRITDDQLSFEAYVPVQGPMFIGFCAVENPA